MVKFAQNAWNDRCRPANPPGYNPTSRIECLAHQNDTIPWSDLRLCFWPLKMGNLLFITSFPWECCWHCFILDFRFLECQMSMWRNWERSIKLEPLIGKLNPLVAWWFFRSFIFYFFIGRTCVVEEKMVVFPDYKNFWYNLILEFDFLIKTRIKLKSYMFIYLLCSSPEFSIQ